MGGCFVPGCKSGHGRTRGVHLFRPKKENSPIWTNILSQIRKDKLFDAANKNHCVCSEHFEDNLIVKVDRFVVKGEVAVIPRVKWTLQNDAVPTKFENLPPSIQPKIPIKRRAIVKVTTESKRRKLQGPQLPNLVTTNETHFDARKWWSSICHNYPQWNIFEAEGTLSIYTLCAQNNNKIPTVNHTIMLSSPPRCFIKGHECTNYISENVVSGGLEDKIRVLSSQSFCDGITGFSSINKIQGGNKMDSLWRSETCKFVSDSIVCTSCKELYRSLLCKHHRMSVPEKQNSSTARTRKKLKYYMERSRLLKLTARNLRGELSKMKASLHRLSLSKLEQQLDETEIPAPMKQNVIHSLRRVTSKKANALRYTSDWLLECLLLKIKSPAAYRHLRDAKILPLPHPNTISKLIAGQRCEFGFNETAMEAIAREMGGKNRRDRQGILVFDEIQLRESLEYNANSHHFDGYIDFGDYTGELVKDGDRMKLANHALVIMYRPFNANWVQPIAAFATKNAATGNALHKVIFEAIIRLEKINAEVLTVVCDGSKPNKSFWKQCGIGKVGRITTHKIDHPCDPTRPLYFCTDFPHLFKCIRNHFHKYRDVEFFNGTANFSFYENLLTEEEQLVGGLRKCPKLSRAHVFPNPFEKMRVPLATQLFSRTVATGIKWYRENRVLSLEGSEDTEEFTLTLNSLFDALNARFPSEGVTLHSRHLQTLRRFYESLKSYIGRYDAGLIEMTFASPETLVALEITLASTIDVVEYLTTELGFTYVLTGKITQDCLEKFFGLIRAAGGREDHPTVTNFTQLFRLLSLYNPLKRILRGNVGTEESVQVLSNFGNQLKEAAKKVKNENQSKIQMIEDALIEKLHDLESSRNIYSSPTGHGVGILEKQIVYHLTGFLCFKSRKLLKCTECCKSLFSEAPEMPEISNLTDILNYGSLHHPRRKFLDAIMKLESAVCTSIEHHSTCGDVILDCIGRLNFEERPDFGCGISGHLEEIVVTLFPDYITTRVHFYSKSLRLQVGKGKATRNKRKESKLQS